MARSQETEREDFYEALRGAFISGALICAGSILFGACLIYQNPRPVHVEVTCPTPTATPEKCEGLCFRDNHFTSPESHWAYTLPESSPRK